MDFYQFPGVPRFFTCNAVEVTDRNCPLLGGSGDPTQGVLSPNPLNLSHLQKWWHVELGIKENM